MCCILLLLDVMKLSLRGYVRHVRRQNKHIQHMHAFVFASVITGVVVGLILYYDYGFWHDVYVNTENTTPIAGDTLNDKGESPLESFSRLFQEAKLRLGEVGNSGQMLLEGTEVYRNE